VSTHNVKMEAAEQEWQMVEVVREHEADSTSDFRLLVQRQDGAWDVTSSIAPHDELNTSRRTAPLSMTLGAIWHRYGLERVWQYTQKIRHPCQRSKNKLLRLCCWSQTIHC
jgi:hypothetical protein